MGALGIESPPMPLTSRNLAVAIASLGFVATVAVSSVFSPGCGSEDDSCAVGKESCACTSGGACDVGLVCASSRCVRLGGSQDGGASDGAVGSPDTNMSLPEAPERACDNLGKLCEKLNACAPAGLQIAYGDLATCTARLKLDCIDGAKAPNTGLTFASAQSCISALATASCEDLLYRNIAACDFKGTRANGMGCGTDDQCQTGRCAKTAAVCGVCAALVKAGNKCGEDEDCEAGLVCSDDDVCVLPAAPGGACTDTQPCQLGYYCANNKCVAQASAPGADCDNDEGCDFTKGLFCRTELGKCQNLGFAKSGDTCGFISGSFAVCSAGATCSLSEGQLQGVCAAAAKDGEPCSDTTPCLEPARCVGGRCQLNNSSTCN